MPTHKPAPAPFRSVLCPIDFSEHSAAALRYAVAVVKRSRGRVRALYVNDPLLVATAAIALGDRGLAETSRGELRDFVSRTLANGSSKDADAVECEVGKGDPAAVIRSTAARHGCDLIVMGSHGLGGFDKRLIGSTTDRMLTKTTVPVLAIPPFEGATGHRPADSWPGPTVMAPLDLGPDSAADVREAAKLAKLFRTGLRLLHVVPQAAPPPWYRADLGAEAQMRIVKAQRQLETLAKAARVRAEVQVVSGSVADEIALMAGSENVGLVVMRLRKGRGIFGGRAGAIAYHVLRQAVTPVLALPSIK